MNPDGDQSAPLKARTRSEDMMNNSTWTLTKDVPVPKDRAVLLWLGKERHGSRLALSKGFKIATGHLNVIDGKFYFDFTTEILAWREVDGLTDDLPLELMEEGL